MPRKGATSKTRGRKRLRRFRNYRRQRLNTRAVALTKYNIHHYLRWETTDRTIPLTNITGINSLGMSFQLDLLQNYTELTALYDQYKIKWVKLHFDWSPLVPIPYDTANAFSGSGAHNPIVYFKRDYDDATAPTEIEMKQSNQTRALRLHPNRNQTIFLRPAILHQIYEGATATAYAPKWRERLDCADVSVPHYGLKMLIKSPPSSNYGTVNIRVQVALECYNTR